MEPYSNPDWRHPLMARILFLTGSVFLFGFLLRWSSSWLILGVLAIAVGFQLIRLAHEITSSGLYTPQPTPAPPPPPPTADLASITFDEVAQTFRTTSSDKATQQCCQRMNEAFHASRLSRRDRDSDYQFFRNIVQHVGIGLLTFRKDGNVQIINSAARRLLRVNSLQNINELQPTFPDLVEAFVKLKTGGRELLRLRSGDETVQLSIFAIELTLRGEEIKLISMSNIQSELEEKEMEAWQNLVRVLTHEIMNSVTPISSLAVTVQEELQQRIAEENQQLSKEELADMHLSLQTISRRSDGLIRFVKEFRNLTHVPKPQMTEIAVRPLLDEMAQLHKKELADNRIILTVSTEPAQLSILADKNMIEQVLINLIKNAIQAFDEQTDRQISLTGYVSEKGRPVISVRDNGQGIDSEALEKIFIPFFSTKKSGSGIGLSLSRQIMRVHDGRITVKSALGSGTEFLLRF